MEYGVPTILKTWGEIWGANDFEKMGWNMGRRDFLKYGAKYGVDPLSKTWGRTWGVNIKKFLIIFLVFHQNDVYELQRPPYRVIIVMV